MVAGTGDLVVRGPGVPHRYPVRPGAQRWAFWWVHCQARTSRAGRLRPYSLGDGLYAVGPGRSGERVERAFGRMLADARWTGESAPPDPTRPDPAEPAGGGGRAEAAVAHGAAVREPALCSLGEIVLPATAREQSRPAGVDARIRRAEALMAADPGAPRTIRSLAGEVSLSPSRFAHLFTEQLGRSPIRRRYGSPPGAYRTGLERNDP